MAHAYDEFRLQISPNLPANGTYSLQILDSPIAAAVGPAGPPDAIFPPDLLAELRDTTKWPQPDGNMGRLKEIGGAVYSAVSNAQVRAALDAALEVAKGKGRGLRLVFSLVSADAAAAAGARLSELPIEALYQGAANFYAPQLVTPVSRAFVAKPDRTSEVVTPPLRMLIVAASPAGLPVANIPEEKTAVETALGRLKDSRLVEIVFCDPPTREELWRRLLEPFHVVHFISHGAVQRIGVDPTPRAFLCLQDVAGNLDPLDADTLDLNLRNNPSVRLVVITACSTAQLPPAAGAMPYGATAYDGMAQRLLAPGMSNVSAVVAMQFDFDGEAAPAFSRAFYETLMTPGKSVDEAVTVGRIAIINTLRAGHRAWVNPVLYWRCQNGQVFDVKASFVPELPEDIRKQLAIFAAQIDIYQKSLADLAAQPLAVRQAAADLEASWRAKIEQLNDQRGALVGDTLRLKGGVAGPGQDVSCPLSIRLRHDTKVETLRVLLRLPGTGLELAHVSAGQNFAGPFLTGTIPEGEVIHLDDVSGPANWAAGEYELAKITLKLNPDVTGPSVVVPIEIKTAVAVPAINPQVIHGMVFVPAPPPKPAVLPPELAQPPADVPANAG
jgi:hypothetical protein